MSGYIGTQPVPQATQTRDSFTCTAGQTSFATSGYTPNFLDVYLNGVKLTATDYTASNGSDVVLASGAATGDVLEVVAFTTFDVVTDTITAAGTALTLDRTGSDGTILDLKKDGSTVGSIGAQTRTGNTELGIGTGDTGLNFFNQGDAICPVNMDNGFDRNGAIDLGRDGVAFKDLYLSGGVFLGGTGSANKLDDYEEGTWTPVLSSSNGESGQSYNSQEGSYTKVGSLVYCSAWINVTSIGTIGGSYAFLKGLPFTVGSGNKNYGGGVIQHWSGFGVNSAGFTIYTELNTTYCYIHYRSSFGTEATYMPPAGWGSSPNLMVTITYRTDS